MKMLRSRLVLISLCLLLLGLDLVVARKKSIRRAEPPCKRLTLYYHETIFNGKNQDNATSAYVATSRLDATHHWFGRMAVFDGPMTVNANLRSPPVARAQGFYFYDMKSTLNAWFAYSLVFNSTEYKGTINLMGADMMDEKTCDISVVGGTGDFFMARGVATLRTDAVQGFDYFRLEMDIKLYECY